MNSNPYETPQPSTNSVENPLKVLRGPAMGLSVSCLFGALVGLLAALNLFELAAALALHRQPRWDVGVLETAILLAMLVSGVLTVIVYRGATCMRRGKSYRFAIVAAIVATLPMLSPSLCLGIPFGIWALIVLRRPQVRAAIGS